MKHFQATEFKQEFERLKFDAVIKQIFGDETVVTYDLIRYGTPRQNFILKKFSAIPFWYLQFLIEKMPARIVDIGCGGNLFKSIIEKIYNIPVYGIDPRPGNPNADEFNFFNSEFSQQHTNAYESVFSINALHFVPLFEFTKIVKEFYNIVSPGGTGFLSLNSARMIDNTPSQWLLSTFNTVMPSPEQIQDYIQNEISNIDIDFVVIDLLITEHRDEYMDGNIRMVFNK